MILTGCRLPNLRSWSANRGRFLQSAWEDKSCVAFLKLRCSRRSPSSWRGDTCFWRFTQGDLVQHAQGASHLCQWQPMCTKVNQPIRVSHYRLLTRYPDDLHKNLEIQFSVEELEILQKHYLRHIQDISKDNSVKVKTSRYLLNLSSCTRCIKIMRLLKTQWSEKMRRWQWSLKEKTWTAWRRWYLPPVRRSMMKIAAAGEKHLRCDEGERLPEPGEPALSGERGPGPGRGMFWHHGWDAEEGAGFHSLHLLGPDGSWENHPWHDNRMSHKRDPDHHWA